MNKIKRNTYYSEHSYVSDLPYAFNPISQSPVDWFTWIISYIKQIHVPAER